MVTTAKNRMIATIHMTMFEFGLPNCYRTRLPEGGLGFSAFQVNSRRKAG
jgi:hypothetical protein